MPGHTERPKFTPREPIQAPNPRAIFLAGTLGFAAIAAASFTAYSALHPAHPIHPVREVAQVPLGPLNEPKIVERTPTPIPSPVPPVQAPSQDQSEASYLRRRDKIEVKDARLVDALTLVTVGTGIGLEIGPGFVDQRVSVEYQDISPLEALQAMAKEYAFSIFDEGGGTFLILPIADKGTPSPKAISNEKLAK